MDCSHAHVFGVKIDCNYNDLALFSRQNLETIISKLSKEQPNGKRNSFMLVSALFYNPSFRRRLLEDCLVLRVCRVTHRLVCLISLGHFIVKLCEI